MKVRFFKSKLSRLIGVLLVLPMLMVSMAGCGNQAAPATSSMPSSPATSSTPSSPTASSNSETKPIQIRVSLEGISTYEAWADKFKELAEKNLPGKVNIVLYKNAQLGGEKEAYEQVTLGSIEIGMGASIQTTYEPKYQVLEFPYIFRDRTHMSKVVTGPIAQELNESLIKNKGIRTIAIADAGFRQVANNIRPIVEPADLKGVKIRVPQSPFRMEMFQAMGATPTPMGYSDLFLALQQKQVDGLELPTGDIFKDSFYDVQKYLSLTNHIYTPVYAVVKESWWQSLPADVRSGLQKAADDAATFTREANVKNEEEYTQKLKDKGMKVNEIDVAAFQQLMKDTIWKKYQSTLGDLIQRVVDTK